MIRGKMKQEMKVGSRKSSIRVQLQSGLLIYCCIHVFPLSYGKEINPEIKNGTRLDSG